ncbi:MAG: 2,3-bisphosphoglycerate-dependent phosphoglycerate mutase [Alphaproteobacteria bacterium]|nr:2,3-bisphosphoglycerate-dependent phosphoglycerate mutase [Alphaproteobacteria bacterium]
MTTKGATKGKLVLFRHGQTEYNSQNLFTGLVDSPLTERGEEQAREAGERLKGIRFDKAYSSSLSRAFNTAALALETSGCNDHLKKPDGSWDIEIDDAVIEADAGDFAGRSHKDDPLVMSWPRGYDIAPPNGESDKHMVERVQKFYDEELLPRLERGETVLVSCHSGIMKAFEIAAGRKPVPDHDIWSTRNGVPNATPVVYEYEAGKITREYRIDGPKP